MSFDCDLFVIGGGSGGVRAARVAAAGGASVHLAEGSRLGGTCVIRGCVPKKLMVYASSFADLPAEAGAYGWDIGEASFSWPSFRERLHAELARLETVYGNLLRNSGVTTHAGWAKVVGPHEVEVAGRVIRARHILVASGGVPWRPEITGAELGLVSDDIFDFETLPESMLILGGGYIACEMACILARLGVKVTQWYRGEQILRGFDDEARAMIADGIRACGVDLVLGADARAIAGTPGDLRVTGLDGVESRFGAVLFATGRRPATQGMGLEAQGVALGEKGEVIVDRFSQTSVPSIHAVGDVTDRINLTPVAIREGMAFVATVFEGKPTPVDHELVPMAVFTQPELGTIGLSEEAARAQEKIEVYTSAFRPMKTAFAQGTQKVMMKLIVSQASRKVLGCHIVAPDAGEMIQLVGIAVKMGATKEDFDRVCAVHPTMAEELVTMRNPTRRD